MVVVADSREQLPYSFEDFPDVCLERDTIETGDYTLRGFQNQIAIERKTVSDLITCLGRDRARFAKELSRARGFPAFIVLVEGTWQQIYGGAYQHSNLNPAAACASIQAFSARWGISFIFAGCRSNAEAFAHGYFLQFLKGKQIELDRALKLANSA